MSHWCSKIRSKADRRRRCWRVAIGRLPIPASLFLRLPMLSGSISSQIRVVTPVAEPDYTWAHSTVKGKRLWLLAARGDMAPWGGGELDSERDAGFQPQVWGIGIMASEHQSVGCNTLHNADIWYVRPQPSPVGLDVERLTASPMPRPRGLVE
jgi:hypothetical protein